MKLNTRAQTAQSPNNNSPIVLVHGLFGSLDNLGVLARDLVTDHDILQVDMRNHGLSGRADEMTYAEMAQDLLDTLDAHNLIFPIPQNQIEIVNNPSILWQNPGF